MSEQRARGRVIVIGAGAAGLAAARELGARRFDVTVLEGRDRVGGRVWTDDSLGHPVDLGAAWLEGTRGNPIAALARELGVKSKRTNYRSHDVIDRDGQPLQARQAFQLFVRAMQGLEKTALLNRERIANEATDLSIAEALAQVSWDEGLSEPGRLVARWALAWRVGADAAEALKDISLRGYWAEGEGEGFGGHYRLFPRGYGQVLVGLARGLDVRLGTRVERIEQDSGGVIVTAGDEVFRADCVVVTLPLGVLERGSVEFVPELPERKRRAIRSLGVGVANKVVLAFPKRFWPRRVHYLGYVSEEEGEFVEWLNVHRYTRAPILSLWSHGDYARAMEARPDSENVARAMDVIRRRFGPGVPDPRASLVTRWASDPLACGSYSSLRVHATYEDFDALAEPVGERMFFAGEATHRQHYGSVHGAFLSGVREAERIAGRER